MSQVVDYPPQELTAPWGSEYMPFLTRKLYIIEVETCILYQYIFRISLQSAG